MHILIWHQFPTFVWKRAVRVDNLSDADVMRVNWTSAVISTWHIAARGLNSGVAKETAVWFPQGQFVKSGRSLMTSQKPRRESPVRDQVWWNSVTWRLRMLRSVPLYACNATKSSNFSDRQYTCSYRLTELLSHTDTPCCQQVVTSSLWLRFISDLDKILEQCFSTGGARGLVKIINSVA